MISMIETLIAAAQKTGLIMEELKKCDFDDCGNEQFLVWRCEKCAKQYCEKHRQTSEHDCPTASPFSVTTLSNNATSQHEFSTNVETTSSASVRDIFHAVETRHDNLEDVSTGKVHANVKSSTIQKVKQLHNTHHFCRVIAHLLGLILFFKLPGCENGGHLMQS